MTRLIRGRVYAAVLDGLDDVGEKYFLVVSNNQRNLALHSVLAVRLTTTRKASLPTVVEASLADPFTGRVTCDDVVELYEDEVRRDLGAVSRGTMLAVDAGLRVALSIGSVR